MDERREVAAEPLGDERARKRPRLVERLVRTRQREVAGDDAGAGDSEDPTQVLLRPDRPVLAGRRARDGDRLVSEPAAAVPR